MTLEFEQRIRNVVRLLARQAAREAVEATNAPSQSVEANIHD